MTYDWFDRNGYVDEIIEPVRIMWLCEYPNVMLRSNLTYKFKVMSGCKKCEELDY